jgi:serine/threonine protein kinase
VDESQVFAQVLKLATPAERAAYLNEVCAGNPQLRAGVEALLQAHAGDPGFLEQPADWLGGTVDEEPAPGTPGEPAPEPRPAEQPGTVLAGRYKLLEPIGEGGMGSVWMAQQTEPVKRLVAVKLIKPGMDSRQVLARFEVERQALALMDHPNIAKVLDAGAAPDGRPFFVMELVKGVPITKYCDEHRLTPRQRLETFVPVCQAIQHAHQKGIIHRDLKPSNVLVALYDDKPVPKVIDFGVAKATGRGLTEVTLHTGFGAVVGTVEYMSPEQASFNQLDVDTRSDIYSLGVLLYKLLTGTTPFARKDLEGGGLLEMLRLIREQEPPKPSTKLSTAEGLPGLAAKRGTEPRRLTALVRGELDWIVMKALEKDRNRRYESANGLAADVQRYLDDEPVLACPPSAGYRLRKFARRNKAAMTTAALVTAALLLGTAVSIWQAARANGERDRAREAERKARVEKDNMQAALDFLWQDVLSQASPDNEPNRGLTVRQLLDRVADRLGKDPGQPPPVEAAVRRMIGQLYSDLGEYREAQQHLRRALDVQAHELGREDPQTLATMHTLGACLYRAGYLDVSPEQLAEGAQVLARTLEFRRLVLGEEDTATLTTMSLLGRCRTLEGQLEEGERLLTQALQTRSRVHGDNTSQALEAMNWLGSTLAMRGKLDQGEALQTRCVEGCRKSFGDDNPLTLAAMQQLARTYLSRDEAGRAEGWVRRALEAARPRLGRRHGLTRVLLADLADTYQLQDRHGEAARLIAELVAEPRVDEETGRLAGGDLKGLRLLGRNLVREGKYTEAEPPLRKYLALFEKTTAGRPCDFVWPRQHGFRTQVVLGASLLGQKKYAQAETVLCEGYRRMKRQPGAEGAVPTPLDRRYLTEALGWLVQIYEEWDKPDQAAFWRKELHKAQAGGTRP